MTFQPARLLVVIAVGLAAPAFATTIKGTVTANSNDAGGYTGTLSNISYAAGSTGGELPSFSQIICIDAFNSFPSSGTVHTYTLYSDASKVIAYSAAASRATDFFNYVVDKYYDSAVLHGNASQSTGYQFNEALWEIASDFSGTRSSLDTARGSIRGSGSLYNTIVADLRNNFSTIETGYRSSAYTVSFLDDKASGYQSMIMLSPLVAAVPEPGTYGLMLGGLGLMGAIARRRAARNQG